ncbi:MAG: tRNA-dihydrouridine synthase family protein [Lachnospiraceae bacterium]|nr:tRNA-dihydrouridine synthase family protein [Lachnospiraceae bacterium]
MDCYFAPMEGITGYVYRNAHHKFYGGVSRYYTPFIAPNQSRKLTSRELNDVLPEHNRGICVVPQILTNCEEDFVWAAEKLQRLGYEEANLNLGCPSGTVVTKNRGAGFLSLPSQLDQFLEKVSGHMGQLGMKFSIKTRIGRSDPAEFSELLRIFNRYPLERLIIHPRVQTDFYRNHPNWGEFERAVKESENPLCYNGDIFTPEDYTAFKRAFPKVDTIMLGRGLLKNPGLAEDLKANAECVREYPRQQRLKNFHAEILAGYREAIPGDRNVLFKMKELWSYLGELFEGGERPLKQIKKAGRMEDYIAAVELLFACKLR